jgi:hypothetical protein
VRILPSMSSRYVLTARIQRPARLIDLSSSMHMGGDPDLDDAQWERRRWSASRAYSDSKLHREPDLRRVFN